MNQVNNQDIIYIIPDKWSIKQFQKKGLQKPYAKSFYFNFHVAKYSQIMSSFTFGEHLKLFLTGTLIVITHIQSSVLWNKQKFYDVLNSYSYGQTKGPSEYLLDTLVSSVEISFSSSVSINRLMFLNCGYCKKERRFSSKKNE